MGRGAAAAELHARRAEGGRATLRDRLLRIADRLGKVTTGSAVADKTKTIHRALGRAGPAPCYTTDLDAARTLLPPGFEELSDPIYTSDAVYAACRRTGIDHGGLPFPHHGGWGATLPLALCSACIRAQASLLPR